MKLPPDWTFRAYAKLWQEHEQHSFSLTDAMKTLNTDKQGLVSDILIRLNSAGWVESVKDPRDQRRKIFHLKNPKTAIFDIIREYSQES